MAPLYFCGYWQWLLYIVANCQLFFTDSIWFSLFPLVSASGKLHPTFILPTSFPCHQGIQCTQLQGINNDHFEHLPWSSSLLFPQLTLPNSLVWSWIQFWPLMYRGMCTRDLWDIGPSWLEAVSLFSPACLGRDWVWMWWLILWQLSCFHDAKP